MIDIVLVGSSTQTPRVAIRCITAASSSKLMNRLPIRPVNGSRRPPIVLSRKLFISRIFRFLISKVQRTFSSQKRCRILLVELYSFLLKVSSTTRYDDNLFKDYFISVFSKNFLRISLHLSP